MQINSTWENPYNTPENRYKLRSGLWIEVIDRGGVVDPIIIDKAVDKLAPYINTTGPGAIYGWRTYELMRRYEDGK